MYLKERAPAAGRGPDVKASPSPVHAHLAEEQSTISQARCVAADPVIARFRAALADIQSSELQRLYGRLSQLDDDSRDAIREFADCIVATVLHPPVECLRNEDSKTSQEYLLNALQRLFRLNDSMP